MENIDWKSLSNLKLKFFDVYIKAFDSPNSDYYPWSKTVKVGTPEEAREMANFLAKGAKNICWDYEIDVYCTCPGAKGWIFGLDSKKMRVANPKSRIFISISGRDCDGMTYTHYYEFQTIEEAGEFIQDSEAWADGPMSYSSMSIDDYELAEYPESRDIFAEQMGY